MCGRTEISIIVSTYNRATSLRETLSCLSAQTLHTDEFEIIVVDDGSSDNTEAVVQEFASQHSCVRIRYMKHHRNRSKAAACNSGAKLAAGRLIVFTDDDIRPVPGWLAGHLKRHKMAGGKVAVTGLVLLPNDWAKRSNWVRYANSNYLKSESIRGRESGKLPPNRLAGGNTSLPLDLFYSAGMFDESMRRGEDCELACKLFIAGVPLLYEPAALVYHYADYIQSIDDTLLAFRKFYESDWRTIQEKYPWFLQKYGHWFLLPYDPCFDGTLRSLRKAATKLLAKRRIQQWLVQLLKWIDGIPFFYCRALYDYTLACEALDAMRPRENKCDPSRNDSCRKNGAIISGVDNR